MEQQYKTIYSYKKKPSSKAFLIAIPMLLYRVKSSKFIKGLNFFQKSVLKLKAYPGISNIQIAKLLGIDEKLTSMICNELFECDLIDESGNITQKGRIARNNSMGLIDVKGESELGYIFRYGDELFPYYQKNISFAQVEEENLLVQTDNGIKKIGFSKLENFHNIIIDDICPNEDQVLYCMKNLTSKVDSEDTMDVKSLNLSFVPDSTGEKVLVCTYVYLPESSRGNYEDEWLVTDPFSDGNSYELKLYLESIKVKSRLFARELLENFGDAETEYNQRYDDNEEWLDYKINEEINARFNTIKFRRLDANIISYYNATVKAHFGLTKSNYTSSSYTMQFILNIERIIEAILKYDFYTRSMAIRDMERKVNDKTNKEVSKSNRIYYIKKNYVKISSFDTRRQKLINTQANSYSVIGLTGLLAKYTMSLEFERVQASKIKGIIKDHLNDIWEIANKRNPSGHGDIAAEKPDQVFNKELTEKFYNIINQIIEKYINIL